MFEKHSNFRFFVVVITIFIGALFFLSDSFKNKTTETSNKPENVVSIATDSNIIAIRDEAVAMGLPNSENSNSSWLFIAIAVTLVNIGGAVGIVFMTSKDPSHV